ncbi:jg24026 [Pararge aegeria aegeria]|uniref:Jg24026 protein n=1 Tax=Pararge aegeria aegeria TaxID=348720 RepID=A0A8S4QSV6_9NEOP|nr:jg24026 [Pararge aegeria aegeria]
MNTHNDNIMGFVDISTQLHGSLSRENCGGSYLKVFSECPHPSCLCCIGGLESSLNDDEVIFIIINSPQTRTAEHRRFKKRATTLGPSPYFSRSSHTALTDSRSLEHVYPNGHRSYDRDDPHSAT